MLFRFVLGVVALWFLLGVVRAAMQGAPPRNRPYRTPGAAGAIAARRKALAVLGLYDGAKPEEIKRAYKDLAVKYHPDRVAHLGPELVELTTEKFKQITAAYELLTGK